MSLLDTAPLAAAEGTAAPETAPQPQPRAPAAPRQPAGLTERQGAAALERLIDWGDGSGDAGADDDTSELPGDEPDDDGADESPPTGEDEGQSEPQDGDKPAPAAIEPPQSWSAEDKAVFAKLPPDAQAVVARRESERDKVINQRTQEIADQRKATEAERAAMEGRTQKYAESLQTMLHLAVPDAEALGKVDWQRLSQENPAEYVRLTAYRDSLRDRVGQIQAEMQRVGQEQRDAQDKRVNEFLTEQKAKLVEKIPEFGDEAKAAVLGRDLTAALTHYGFSPQEIGQALDHRLMVVARDAMLYRQAEAARKAAEGKRNNPAPRVQQPNAAANTDDGKASRIRDVRTRFGKSHSDRDAALLIEHLLP